MLLLAPDMYAVSEPSFSAYTWDSGSGYGNMTAADKVLPEMKHMIDAHWYVMQIN
jgi:hypothetical protein